jgi:hypothetical protein
MGGRRRRPARRRVVEPPIPLDAVDLLAGLAPGVALHADDLPPGIDEEAPSEHATPARVTVAEAGKMIRAGDDTVRRLIRTDVLRPVDPARPRRFGDVGRAGVPPRGSGKPGE